MTSTILTMVILLAGAYAGTAVLDSGPTRAWAAWVRFSFGGAILFAVVGAVALLHSVLSPDHSDLSPSLESDNRGPTLRKGLLVAAAGFLVFFAFAKVLVVYARIPVERTWLAGLGIAIALLALRKPWWFWEHWKARVLRSLIGDTATTVFYLAIATLLLYGALIGRFE